MESKIFEKQEKNVENFKIEKIMFEKLKKKKRLKIKKLRKKIKAKVKCLKNKEKH